MEKEVSKRLGAALAAFRKRTCAERSINMDTFYGAVGVKRHGGLKWENGTHDPPFDKLDALLRHYGGSLLLLLGDGHEAVVGEVGGAEGAAHT